MKIKVTARQAIALRLAEEELFVRSAFYIGHTYGSIVELVHSDVAIGERTTIIRLACALGMSDADTVEIINVNS